MFNQTGIHSEKLAGPVQILYNVQNQVAVPILVDSTMASVTVDGRKVVKAGTPLAGDLTNRSTPFKAPAAAVGGSNPVPASPAVGVLVHDVDITNGNANGSLLIWGFVNLNRLDTATQTLATNAAEDLAGKVWMLRD